jgi:hypothetical protein
MEKIQIVFDGPPSHESGRFIEVEDANGCSIRVGEWVHRPDGYWALVLNAEVNREPQSWAEALDLPIGGRGVVE